MARCGPTPVQPSFLAPLSEPDKLGHVQKVDVPPCSAECTVPLPRLHEFGHAHCVTKPYAKSGMKSVQCAVRNCNVPSASHAPGAQLVMWTLL